MKQIASQAVILPIKSDILMRIIDATAAQHRPGDAVSKEQPWTNLKNRVLRLH
jgi:hypothetical protein